MNSNIIEVKDLVVDFKTDDGVVHAVKKISFNIDKTDIIFFCLNVFY